MNYENIKNNNIFNNFNVYLKKNVKLLFHYQAIKTCFHKK